MSEHKELHEYRAQMLRRTIAAAQEFCENCRRVKKPFESISGDGWSVHQIAAHVRDVNQHVYGSRLHQAVEQERPVFQNYDGDAWIASSYDANEPLEKILNEFLASARDLVAWLETLSASDWSRPTYHEVYGEFAMQSWAERGLAHIEEHNRAVRNLAQG